MTRLQRREEAARSNGDEKEQLGWVPLVRELSVFVIHPGLEADDPDQFTRRSWR